MLGIADLTFSKIMELAQVTEASRAKGHSLKETKQQSEGFKADLPIIHKPNNPAPAVENQAILHKNGNFGMLNVMCVARKAILPQLVDLHLRRDPSMMVHSQLSVTKLDLKVLMYCTRKMNSEAREFLLLKFYELSSNPIEIQVKTNDEILTMEVNKKAAVSKTSNSTRKEPFLPLKLQPCKLALKI